jgi:hypothetical protein
MRKVFQDTYLHVAQMTTFPNYLGHSHRIIIGNTEDSHATPGPSRDGIYKTIGQAQEPFT